MALKIGRAEILLKGSQSRLLPSFFHPAILPFATRCPP
jgi:hypothetical protein